MAGTALLDIPATHPEALWMVRHATHVCGRCGVPGFMSYERGLTWNLAPHVCAGDFEWLGEDSDAS